LHRNRKYTHYLDTIAVTWCDQKKHSSKNEDLPYPKAKVAADMQSRAADSSAIAVAKDTRAVLVTIPVAALDRPLDRTLLVLGGTARVGAKVS
jgi:hypothetical protein